VIERYGGAPDGLVGRTIGHYLVRQKLAVGGTGSVYVAEHPWIGKRVALKVLHVELAARPDIVGRFFNEARAVNDIQHPNIVDIIDFGVIEAMSPTEPAVVYLLMEYLEGESLGRLSRRDAPLPLPRALTIALQICDALAASHAKGIVHRDLKPDNVMLVPRGREHDFVKILDFGIAKLTVNATGSQRTQTGVVIGTPQYMSPEQCEGRSTVDHRTDIYALGVVLYEMLTGRVPFRGEGFAEVLVQALNTAPVPPSAIAPGIPPHVERAVLRALAKRPEDRFQRVGDLAAALQDPGWQQSGSPVGPLPGRSGAFAASPPVHGGSFAGPAPVHGGSFAGPPPVHGGSFAGPPPDHGGPFAGPPPGQGGPFAGPPPVQGGAFAAPLPREVSSVGPLPARDGSFAGPLPREVSGVGPLPHDPAAIAAAAKPTVFGEQLPRELLGVGPLPHDPGAIAAAARPTAFVGPLPRELLGVGPLPHDPGAIAAAARPAAFAEVERLVPTTLNGSAAQSTALPARRGVGVFVAVGLAAILAISGVMVGVVAHRAADQPAAPAAAPVEAPAEVAPRIRLLIKSKPPGASVVVEGDTLGVTPFSGELDRRDARVQLELRLAGYQTATRTIALGDDVVQTFALDRADAADAPSAPSAPTAPTPPAAAPSPAPGAPSVAPGATPSSPQRPEAVRP
jgi:serine/threonine protein kinase